LQVQVQLQVQLKSHVAVRDDVTVGYPNRRIRVGHFFAVDPLARIDIPTAVPDDLPSAILH
jgi:hypothetical protein